MRPKSESRKAVEPIRVQLSCLRGPTGDILHDGSGEVQLRGKMAKQSSDTFSVQCLKVRPGRFNFL